MADEFKIRTGLMLNETQPVSGITDSSSFTNDSSSLATVNAIKNYITSNVYNKIYVDGSLSTRDTSIDWLFTNGVPSYGTEYQIPYMKNNYFSYTDSFRYDNSLNTLFVGSSSGPHIRAVSGKLQIYNSALQYVEINPYLQATESGDVFLLSSVNTLTNPATDFLDINNGPAQIFSLDIYGNIIIQGSYKINDSNTYIDEDVTHNMTFTDAVSGTKTLAELSSWKTYVDGSLAAMDFWDISTNNTTVYLKDPSDNVELSSIEVKENGGATTFVNMPISNVSTNSAQSYDFKIDGSSALKVWGKGAGTALSETAVVVNATYFALGDPCTNGSWRLMIDSSGDLSVQKLVANSWVQKGNFN